MNTGIITTMRRRTDRHWPGIPLVVEVLAAAPVFPPEGGDSVVLPLSSVDAASEGVLAQVVPGDHGRTAAPHLPGRLSAGLAVPATVRPRLSVVLSMFRYLHRTSPIHRLFHPTIYRLLIIDSGLYIPIFYIYSVKTEFNNAEVQFIFWKMKQNNGFHIIIHWATFQKTVVEASDSLMYSLKYTTLVIVGLQLFLNETLFSRCLLITNAGYNFMEVYSLVFQTAFSSFVFCEAVT